MSNPANGPMQGVRVLDLGSGSGRDCYIASKLVGEKGARPPLLKLRGCTCTSACTAGCQSYTTDTWSWFAGVARRARSARGPTR